MENKKGMALIASVLLFVFYIAIVFFTEFAVLHLYFFPNFVIGLTFQLISLGLLFTVIMMAISGKVVETGFMIPIVIFTVIYSIAVNILTLVGLVLVPPTVYILINLIALFVLMVVIVPMFVMGKK